MFINLTISFIYIYYLYPTETTLFYFGGNHTDVVLSPKEMLANKFLTFELLIKQAL